MTGKKNQFQDSRFVIYCTNQFIIFSRNRLVDEGNAAEQCVAINPDGSTYHAYSLVLMDENLLNVAREKPFYITEESQRTLSTAIRRDTDFLEANGMMDYSLLVAIDGCRNELILGIIDYIRVYTWDKQLESLIKSTGLLGGAGKTPTVVAPDVYKKRSEPSMNKYFTLVPGLASNSTFHVCSSVKYQ